MAAESIAGRVRRIQMSLPPGVLLVAAAKTRTAEEVRAAIEAGVRAVGYNYVQEAGAMRRELAAPQLQSAQPVRWHLIGHLQRNKAKRAVSLFDMIETVDSVRIAQAIDRHCTETGKTMPVLIEVNSGQESNKTGVAPGDVEGLVRRIAGLPHIRVQGLMTMGPRFGDPSAARPYFRLTRTLFDRLSVAGVGDTDMRYLSMGMSNSYRVAIEEGANIVRIGARLFGLCAC